MFESCRAHSVESSPASRAGSRATARPLRSRQGTAGARLALGATGATRSRRWGSSDPLGPASDAQRRLPVRARRAGVDVRDRRRNSLVDIGLHTLPARLVPEELLARVFGVKASPAALSGAVGAFVTPFAIGLLGARGALGVLGLLAPVVAALAWHRLHAIDAAVARRDRDIEVLGGVVLFRPLSCRQSTPSQRVLSSSRSLRATTSFVRATKAIASARSKPEPRM